MRKWEKEDNTGVSKFFRKFSSSKLFSQNWVSNQVKYCIYFPTVLTNICDLVVFVLFFFLKKKIAGRQRPALVDPSLAFYSVNHPRPSYFIYLMIQVSKQSFWIGLCRKRDTFSFTAGVFRLLRAKRDLLYQTIFFAEMVNLFWLSK